VFAANRAAAAAAETQAATWANPEVEVGIGRARAREPDAQGERSVATVGGIRLSQRLELPSKRAARRAAAAATSTVTERAGAVDTLELDLEVAAAAIAVALADLQAAQAAEAHRLATQVHATAGQLRHAGESDAGDVARAAAEMASTRLALAAASTEQDTARAVLRTWCGPSLPAHFSVADAVPDSEPMLTLSAAVTQALADHPRLDLLTAQAAAANAALASEERAWYPDLTLGVEGNRESDTDDLGISLGMELPLWDRHAGGIAEARAEAVRSHADLQRQRADLERQVINAWNAAERERLQIRGIRDDLLPAAREALRLKLAAYAAGDAALVDLSDAQRGLLSAEQTLLAARAQAAQARLDLARALGGLRAWGTSPASTTPTTHPTNSHTTTPTGAQP
jgi:cobalt-zinc-cadmium efflux system outer membrane protein